MTTAKELAETSLRLTKEQDRDGWIALFAPDALVEDPVGGKPHQGIDAITQFVDFTISTVESFDYDIHFNIVAAGMKLDMDVVNIYATDGNGKLTSLRSFWDGSRQGG
jgi:steroid delta-isomerase